MFFPNQDSSRWISLVLAAALHLCVALAAMLYWQAHAPIKPAEALPIVSARLIEAPILQPEAAQPVRQEEPTPPKKIVKPDPKPRREIPKEITPQVVEPVPAPTDPVPVLADAQAKSAEAAPNAIAVSTTAVATAPPAPPAPEPITQPRLEADYADAPIKSYPPISKQLGEEGTVLIEVLVGTDGSVKQVRLLRSSGSRRLDKAALAAAPQGRFKPAQQGNKPVEVWYRWPFVFKLDL